MLYIWGNVRVSLPFSISKQYFAIFEDKDTKEWHIYKATPISKTSYVYTKNPICKSSVKYKNGTKIQEALDEYNIVLYCAKLDEGTRKKVCANCLKRFYKTEPS